jgi:glycosyltransferase involved in cell wall biosynthesis
MRIGLVIYGSLATLSGGYLYDRKLVEQLQFAGHQVEVFGLAWRDYAKHLGDNLDFAWLQRLADADVDLMLQDELNHPSLLLANLRRRGARASYPVVSIVHHLRCSEMEHAPLLTALYREVERIYLNSVDALLCNSRTTRHSVEALLRTAKPTCVALPAADHLPPAGNLPAITTALLAQRSRSGGPLRLLFVGNLIPRKGLHTILDGLALLSVDSWSLTIVGRTDIDYGYTKLIRERCSLFPPGAITFTGRVDDDTLAALYRSHHMLAVPSYEGFGIVYLEAMRWGLPVIASTAGAAREIVSHGANGFLVTPGNARAVAKYVAQLHANREYLLALSDAARHTYLAHPTWQQSMAHAAAWLSTLPRRNP